MNTLPDISESTKTLPVTKMKTKMKDIFGDIFACLTRTMQKNRIGHCDSSNNITIVSLKFLYIDILK